MLWTVHVPRFDRENDRSFDIAGIVNVLQPGKQFGIVINDTCCPPEFHPLAISIVHQKNVSLGVFRQIAECDVLPISAEISERQSPVI